MSELNSRRNFLKGLGAAGIGAAAAASIPMLANAQSGKASGNIRSSGEKGPNVIVVMADDLGYGELSCYGQTRFQTPHLDKMAADGMKFTDHYSGASVCAPARCTLITGMHTGHCYIRGNKAFAGGDVPLPMGLPGLGHVFKDAGYKTGVIGKWGLGRPDNIGSPLHHGFDFFYGYDDHTQAHRHYPTFLWRNDQREAIPENENNGRQAYSHDLFMKEAFNFIRENKDEPFFLYVPVIIPHADIDAPPEYVKDFSGMFGETEKPFTGTRQYRPVDEPFATFAGMVNKLDESMGELNRFLESMGLDENTLVIFTSDNGPHEEAGFAPEFFDSTAGLRGIKRDFYEGGIRVPMIAKWPARIKPGSVTEHPSAFWDYLPTFADITGQPEPAHTDGVSFLPTLVGNDREQNKHEYLYWEFARGKDNQNGRQAVRMGDWKGVRYGVEGDGEGPLEVYNLKADPSESHDLADSRPDIARQLNEHIKNAHVKSMLYPFRYETAADEADREMQHEIKAELMMISEERG